MSPFDPKNPPDWVKRMLERAATAKGAHFHAELNEGQDGSAAISLGAGTYVAPLPVGWSLHPARPYEGRLRIKEGYDVSYRIESYEDAEAARGGPAILSYVKEPEFEGISNTPADVVNDFLIYIPGHDPAGKDIVWKCIEPLGGTHVRELVLRCPLVSAELIEHRESIARAIGEWMGLGRFAPEPTPLDRIAHTATLERRSFQGNVLMRVPRAWKIQTDSENEGRELFVGGDPDERETFWLISEALQMPSEEFAKVFGSASASGVWDCIEKETEKHWLAKARETLPDGDLLFATSAMEEGDSGPFRRLEWYRYAIRDEFFVWTEISLVTLARHLDDPAQKETAALFEREVRNAILSRPPPECD